MAAMRWLPFLCLAVAAAGSMLQQARAQADRKGMLNTCSWFRMRVQDTIL